MSPPLNLVLGPLLFNWSPDAVRDFYGRIADETEVGRVYLGEVVCGKRAPLLETALADAAERLQRAGKAVVFSTPALPATPREQKGVRALAGAGGLVEVNDLGALASLPAGARFVAGPFLNIYNEAAASELVSRGCQTLCANVELSLAAITKLHRACPGLEIEILAYGRLPLALSGRCYHARLHGLHKDSCQFVCDRDPDGLSVSTLEGEAFLALNGVMTMSHGVQVVGDTASALREAGVTGLRLSPQTGDMTGVIAAYGRFAEGAIGADELAGALRDLPQPGPLISGYLQGAPGMRPIQAA